MGIPQRTHVAWSPHVGPNRVAPTEKKQACAVLCRVAPQKHGRFLPRRRAETPPRDAEQAPPRRTAAPPGGATNLGGQRGVHDGQPNQTRLLDYGGGHAGRGSSHNHHFRHPNDTAELMRARHELELFWQLPIESGRTNTEGCRHAPSDISRRTSLQTLRSSRRPLVN
jgi:hypothetical protein